VNVIGVDIEMEQIAFETLAPYLKMVQAAKDNADLTILINSAFRTFQRQAALFELSKHGGNNAAPPGGSNHQHGLAFDLNTLHNKTDGSDKIYEWFKAQRAWAWVFARGKGRIVALGVSSGSCSNPAAGEFMMPGNPRQLRSAGCAYPIQGLAVGASDFSTGRSLRLLQS